MSNLIIPVISTFSILTLMVVSISVISFQYGNAQEQLGNDPVVNETNQDESARSQAFTAILSGGEKVPPVQTDATGEASFKVTGSESIEYVVKAKSIEKVTGAHIGFSSGTIIVTLSRPDEPTDPSIVAEGTITASSLEGGPMQGRTVSDLVNAMESGSVYVNVRTEAYPNGEIRGQISPAQ